MWRIWCNLQKRKKELCNFHVPVSNTRNCFSVDFKLCGMRFFLQWVLFIITKSALIRLYVSFVGLLYRLIMYKYRFYWLLILKNLKTCLIFIFWREKWNCKQTEKFFPIYRITLIFCRIHIVWTHCLPVSVSCLYKEIL